MGKQKVVPSVALLPYPWNSSSTATTTFTMSGSGTGGARFGYDPLWDINPRRKRRKRGVDDEYERTPVGHRQLNTTKTEFFRVLVHRWGQREKIDWSRFDDPNRVVEYEQFDTQYALGPYTTRAAARGIATQNTQTERYMSDNPLEQQDIRIEKITGSWEDVT